MIVDKVIGYALYLELQSGEKTSQVLLMPEGETMSGAVIPMALYKRTLSKATPKTSWSMLGSSHIGPVTTGMNVSDTKLTFITSYFTNLVNENYRVFKEPIVVEVLVSDLESVRTAKTPYRVIGRMLNTRKYKDFPVTIYGGTL